MNNMKVGFQGVGKLQEAEGLLFASAAFTMVDCIRGAMEDFDDDQEPLFAMLTPHHRLELLAEVATGLLVPGTPLPPDTLQHHSTYHAVLKYASMQIDIEIDSQRLEGSEPGPAWEEADLRAKMERMAAEGRGMLELEREQQKRVDKQARTRRKGTCPEIDPKDLAAGNVACNKEHTERLRREFESFLDNGSINLENLRRAQSEARMPASSSAVEATRWRRLAMASYAERRKGAPDAIALSVDSCDTGLWSLQHRMMTGAGFKNSKEYDELLACQPIDFAEIERNPAKRAAYERLKGCVAAATEAFERCWTAEGTVRAERTLMLLLVAPREGYSVLESSARARENDASRLSLVSEVESWQEKHGSAHEQLRQNLIRTLRQGARVAWAAAWHDELQKRGLRHSVLADRLSALRSMPEPEMPAWAPALGTFSSMDVEVSPDEIAPWQWRDARERSVRNTRAEVCECCSMQPSTGARLLKCGRCQVARYCSAECQKRMWATHKPMCQMWAEMRNS
ncbi:hypothetical protein CYMTET_6837 [Cymbomonas tetramitiformis]|uniref:MYND-type domain-containing protein n=1 Tax=Cymbomonas tetramitiformis TaxID=36881 RepID=A0AAE0GW98_9CHLO|nr:hypothetical protein CYMTET_6837 [Cymbomonas tetramitiformis]